MDNRPTQFGEYHLSKRLRPAEWPKSSGSVHGLVGFEKILVIKKVLKTLAKDESLSAFLSMASDYGSIAHVNIVQVFDLDQVDGTYFMAMEYVHGMDLARLISRSRHQSAFPIPLAMFIITEVLKALQFAHERTDDAGIPLRIVHCDISPQNMLLSYSGEVKITDFGISRAAFQSKGVHEVVRGKYAYMSPEQVNGKVLDARSDIFSLGIVLFELLTGRRLFKGKNREETLERVRRAEVSVPGLIDLKFHKNWRVSYSKPSLRHRMGAIILRVKCLRKWVC